MWRASLILAGDWRESCRGAHFARKEVILTDIAFIYLVPDPSEGNQFGDLKGLLGRIARYVPPT